MKIPRSRSYSKSKKTSPSKKTVSVQSKNSPSQEVVIGKIFWTDCIHCINMGDGFQTIGKNVIEKRASGGATIKLVEIERNNGLDEKVANLNKIYFGGAPKLSYNGFPTLFMISGGKVHYYNGKTNFLDNGEKEINMKNYQQWIESNIKSVGASATQRGGGCGCGNGLFSQRGGWNWRTKTKRSKTKSHSRSKKSRNTKKISNTTNI